MTKQTKCDYIRLRAGLAIRRTPNSKNWGIYMKLDNHKPAQFSLRTPNKDEAIDKAWEEYSMAKILLRNGQPIKQPKQRLSLHQIIDELIKEHNKAQTKTTEKGKEPKHATHIRLFNRIKDFYPVELSPSGLDTSLVRKYFLSQQPYSDTQLIATRYCFTQIFDRSFEKKIINKDQIVELRKIKVEKIRKETRDHLTRSELSILGIFALTKMKEAHGKGKHVRRLALFYILFLFHSGIRAGEEALGLRWSDFSFNKNDDLYCIIREGKTKNYEKNNRYVIFDIMAEDCLFQYALRRYKGLPWKIGRKALLKKLINEKPNDIVFSTRYSNKPTFDRIFSEWVKELQSYGELPKNKTLTLYSLRHSYITNAIMNDVPYPLIAENAGTSVSMIEKHYSHISVMTNKARETLLRDKMLLLKGTGENEETRKKVNNIIDIANSELA
ncbi:tyrosine-type recombinase/integrase [Vibrio vulnificus]|uniref:tyrosine-type recombinase/integrase n=1 Tax=Vibrio vulnificus TaxID=672 RepID=UPI00215C7855|nr:site-specific integrase [Vibrio vulnificus]MCR9500677.1 site-specific integrase [Vibrio vulnificus]